MIWSIRRPAGACNVVEDDGDYGNRVQGTGGVMISADTVPPPAVVLCDNTPPSRTSFSSDSLQPDMTSRTHLTDAETPASPLAPVLPAQGTLSWGKLEGDSLSLALACATRAHDGLLVVVTPDMHRLHHSVEDDEANSNFGFNLPWWDRLFGTYRDQPRAGHQGMTIGIHKYREPKQVAWLPGMLWLPFKGKITGYAINRREWNQPDEK